MALYVIADLHLSSAAETNKSMEVFGDRWTHYTERLAQNWRHLVAPTDTVVIPGDISWATTLAEAREDLAFIDALPGKKILMKGNHDFWWSSMKKMEDLCRDCSFHTLSFLYHDAVRAEGMILAGTRGWIWTDAAEAASAEGRRILAREALRLEMSLTAAERLRAETPDHEIVAFFHYPPVWNKAVCTALTEPLRRFGCRRAYFGHIHGFTGERKFRSDDITYTLVSADALAFTPCAVPREVP